ncbi:MAG: hypothetical protein H7A40_04140 [Chlamydiales bacterium]|nr:hypothetical protein [Chlamydiales bacterium]
MRGKAFYNLIKMKWEDNHNFDVQPWQVEDLRSISDEKLFERLAQHDIILTPESILLYAEKCDGPEELTDCLLLDGKNEKLQAQVYLLAFEAWRRFCPKKQTLSVFCDELDHLIEQFDSAELDDVEPLYNQLLELCKIMDQNVDQGVDTQEITKLLDSICAHDIESFTYEFIAGLIDAEQRTMASMLLDAFYPYAEDKRWFDFLRVRLLAESDEAEGKIMLDRLFVELQEEPDIDLGFEMLHLLSQLGERSAFQVLLDNMSSWLQTEEDFQHLLSTVRDYFCAFDFDQEEKVVDKMLHERADIDPETKFFPTDPCLKKLKEIVNITQQAQF